MKKKTTAMLTLLKKPQKVPNYKRQTQTKNRKTKKLKNRSNDNGISVTMIVRRE
jgi:hypothetical protein